MSETQVPNRWSVAVFQTKASVLQVRRLWQDLVTPPAKLQSAEPADFPFLIAESIIPLFDETSDSERSLQLGKIQNLRKALRGLACVELPVNSTFSFWKQVGRATRRGGFVEGRQISEGCLVPAIGGGLCQLSNALYDVAMKAGLEIVERHPHSRIVPGSAAAEGRDATVFWNYIDLRFRSDQPLMITARMDRNNLVVQIFAKQSQKLATKPIEFSDRKRSKIDVAAHSCASCGVASCFRNPDGLRHLAVSSEVRTAYLVDAKLPEWAEYLSTNKAPQDVLCLPMNGEKWRQPQYAWDIEGFSKIIDAPLLTLISAYRQRKLASQGAARQTALLARAEALAHAYSDRLPYDVTRLVIAQNLVLFLWQSGALGGRHFEILTTRLPMHVLQSTLDHAFELHPESTTLNDFRAPNWIVQAERKAFNTSDKIITAHSAIASLFPNKTTLIDWPMPMLRSVASGNQIAFLGPVAGRKGAYEMREAAIALDIELTVVGRELEGENFWQDVKVVKPDSVDWLNGVRLVVQPSFIEERPTKLLEAIACGIPVIASTSCGVGHLPGVVEIAPGDANELIRMISTFMGD